MAMKSSAPVHMDLMAPSARTAFQQTTARRILVMAVHVLVKKSALYAIVQRERLAIDVRRLRKTCALETSAKTAIAWLSPILTIMCANATITMPVNSVSSRNAMRTTLISSALRIIQRMLLRIRASTISSCVSVCASLAT